MSSFFSVSVYLVCVLYLNRNLFSFGNFSFMIFVKNIFYDFDLDFLFFFYSYDLGFLSFYTVPEFLMVLFFSLLMLTLIFSLAV